MNVPAASICVLLVEPHADTRQLYDFGLRAAGFDVVTAADVASATVAFATYAPSIVVGAVGPRDCGEVALLTRFAEERVPVVALTTFPLDPNHALCRASIISVLMKPCVPSEVASAIREALDVLPR